MVVVVGADVAALVPSLSDLEVGIICQMLRLNTNIKLNNINYKIAAKLVSIHISDSETRLSPTFPILPRRTSKQGVRPGVTSNPDNESSWWYPMDTAKFTELQKRMLLAKMIQIAVVTMMNTHLYEFNGKIFLQQAGGPIGLRGTCAVARVVMNHWDTLWIGLLKAEKMTHEEADRYMDDLRVFMLALKMGWRWRENGFYFCKEWEKEDLESGKSTTLRKAENMILAMNSLLKFLKFTMEIAEQFEDGKLPTLDTKIWMENMRVW